MHDQSSNEWPIGKVCDWFFFEIGLEMVPIPELEQRQAFVETIAVSIVDLGVYTFEVSIADHDSPNERKAPVTSVAAPQLRGTH